MKKLIIFAIAAALLCGVFMYIYLNSVESRVTEAQKEHAIPTEKVLIAAKDIPAYMPITADMLSYKEYPQGYIPEDAARELEQVEGLQSDGMIAQGEIIFTSVLGTAEEKGSSLSYRIPEGMRAMSIDVATSQGVAGYLTVGDFVDVMQFLVLEVEEKEESEEVQLTEDGTPVIYVTEEKEKEEKEEPVYLTTVVLEGVELIALGSSNFTGEDGTLYTNVTLSLTPEQCAMLFTARSMNGSTLYLTLRRRDCNDHEWSEVLEFDAKMTQIG